jgi:Bacterial Ig domain
MTCPPPPPAEPTTPTRGGTKTPAATPKAGFDPPPRSSDVKAQESAAKVRASVDTPAGAPPTEANTVALTRSAAASRPKLPEPVRTVVDAPLNAHAAQPALTALTEPSSPPHTEVVATQVISAAREQPTPTRPAVSRLILGLVATGSGPLATDDPRVPFDSPLGLALMAVGTRPRQFEHAAAEGTGSLPASSTLTNQTIDGLVTGDLNAADVHGDQRALAEPSTTALSAPVTVDAASTPASAPSVFTQVKAATPQIQQSGRRSANPDTKAPTVSLTAPAAGATVSGTVTLSANASDNVGVARVQFLMDGTPLAEDTTSPYSVSWNTTAANNGTHTLSAQARDAAGNTTTTPTRTVTVANDTTSQLPVTTTPIEISWPADGHPLYPSAVTISGNRAYVYGGDVITVIDTTTNAVVESTALYNEPPVITPDGRKYVPNPNLYWQGNAPYDSVDVINTATNTVIKNIQIPICYECAYANPSGPRDAVMRPGGQRVYVSEDYWVETGPFTTVVTMIDTATDSVLGYASVAPTSDMEIAPNGTIYGASAEYPVVTVYNADVGTIDSVPVTTFGYYNWSPTTTLALNSRGTRAYVVVSDYGVGQHVSTIDIDPTSPAYNTEIAVITERTTALSPDGSRRYVAQPDGKTVVVYDTTTNTAIGSFTTDQNSGASPRSIAVAPNGTLYITDANDNKVYGVTVGNPSQQN